MTPTRQSQVRAALAARPPDKRATVRFLPRPPTGRALVAALKVTAAAARQQAAASTCPGVRDGFLKIAAKREARIADLEAELRGRQEAGEIFPEDARQ